MGVILLINKKSQHEKMDNHRRIDKFPFRLWRK